MTGLPSASRALPSPCALPRPRLQSGCTYDNERVWSSTSCGAGGHITQGGAGSFRFFWPERCEGGSQGDDQSVAYARCCADAVGGPLAPIECDHPHADVCFMIEGVAFFTISGERMSHASASQACARADVPMFASAGEGSSSMRAGPASLAVVDTRGKDRALSHFLAALGEDDAFYIGAVDADREGTWLWPNGSGLVYSNWAPGEPNNYNPYVGEDCAEVRSPYVQHWNDVRLCAHLLVGRTRAHRDLLSRC